MNNGRNDCQRIPRRVLLTGTALGFGAAAAAAAVSHAAAQQKLSQADAKYQGTPKDGRAQRRISVRSQTLGHEWSGCAGALEIAAGAASEQVNFTPAACTGLSACPA